MQVVADIFKVLFFPGLLFMVICGSAIAFVEGRVGAAFFGGKGSFLPPLTSAAMPGEGFSVGELLVLLLPLSAMGTAGFLLVGAKGDLLVLALLFSAVELLPLRAATGGGERALAHLSLAFRAGFTRLLLIFVVVITLSLRFKGDFAPGLDTFKGEGAFSALPVWEGAGFGLMLAALACAAAAMLIYLVGRPSWELLGKRGEGGYLREAVLVASRWSGLAAGIILFVLVFLGYPWEGRMGLAAWSGAALGTAAVVASTRAWAGGRTSSTLRRWQESGLLLALLSLALALAAAW